MPPKARHRRRKRRAPQSVIKPVELPSHKPLKDTIAEDPVEQQKDCTPPALARSEDETPATSQAPSDADSTGPTTPSSAVTPLVPPRSQPATAQSKPKVRPAIPLVPIVPAVPQLPTRRKNSQRVSISAASTSTKVVGVAEAQLSAGEASSTGLQHGAEISSAVPVEAVTATSPTTTPPPKSWAYLLTKTTTLPAITSKSGEANSSAHINGFSASMAGSLVDVLSSFDASGTTEDAKIEFLEPRGLVNTGNMCYMNAVNNCSNNSLSESFG